MEFIKYNTTNAIEYVDSGYVNIVKNCNGWQAINTGTTIVRVNEHILYPGVPGVSNGDSITVGGNLGEIFDGNIKIAFNAGGVPSVSIDQKFYVSGKIIKTLDYE